MYTPIKQSELRNNNADIMRRVAAGESFTVTVHGRPVADLIPRGPAVKRRERVPAAEFDAALARLMPLDVERWREDMAQADALFGLDLPEDPFPKRSTG